MTPPESCPPFAELEELATDRLADAPSARIRAHVTACTTCARQLEELRADLEVGSRLRRALGGVHDSKLPEIEGYVVKREVGQRRRGRHVGDHAAGKAGARPAADVGDNLPASGRC